MNRNHHTSPTLLALARQEITDAGFLPDFPPEARVEAEIIAQAPPADGANVKDLRNILWSSIDNDASRDLDQIEYVEKLDNGDIRLMIGVADVAEFVSKDSPIDAYAHHNTVSLYTPLAIFPMLPPELSTGITSLLSDVDRLAMVIDMVVGDEGQIHSKHVYHAQVRNHAKLSYKSIGRWLESGSPLPVEVAAVPGLEAQLRLQDEVTDRLRALRKQNGAIEFDTIEAEPIATDGQITGVEIHGSNRARDIIENFMIAANTQLAGFLEEKGIPSLRRVVRRPERWPRIVELAANIGEHLPEQPDSLALAEFLARRKASDPNHFADLSLAVMKLMGPGEYRVEAPGIQQQGHFGLAVQDYTHSTAPNRRYPDLVTQRQVKAALQKIAPPYSVAELEQIADYCTKMGDAARKVERTTRKAAIATLLSHRLGQQFDAIVTGVKTKGTFARLIELPADGMVVLGARGLDVGDRIRVRLLSANPERGYIDFERL
jgi:exoribonuclease-2